jgi:hypothetical protein
VEHSFETLTPIGASGKVAPTPPRRSGAPRVAVETHTRTIAYEKNAAEDALNANNGTIGSTVDVPGELISSKAVTTGNRTVETLTYKVERDGVIETHVEHRVTIHGADDVDHDAELSRAILEATKMNPEMTVEKIEVKQETTQG